MKILSISLILWLAASVVVNAQFNRDQTPNSLYGASPSSPPNMFQNPKPLVAPPNTANATNSTDLTTPTDTPLGSGSITPVTLGQTAVLPPVAAPTPVLPAKAATTPTINTPGTDVVLPQTMEMNDDTNHLAPGDRFLIKVVEDGDPPYLLFLNGDGEVNGVHYIKGKMNAKGMTLKTLAEALKQQYESTYYKKATVLLALSSSNHVKEHVNIIGQVVRPGFIDYPPDSQLTLWQALLDAGSFTPAADREHVVVMHANPSDPANPTKTIYNVAELLDRAIEPNYPVEPGDFITVPSKQESGSTISITGEVGREVTMPLSPNEKTTVNEALLQVGWTQWSNHNVKVIHFDKDGKQTGSQYVDIDAIRKEGDKSKDVVLQPGDAIIVPKKFWSFGND